MSNDNNPVPELLEFLLRASKNSKKETKILGELRINSATLEGPEGLSFTVSLKRAWLSLDLEGLEPIPGSRYGEPVRPNELSIKQKTVNETLVQNQVNANASVHLDSTHPHAALDLGADYNSKGKTTVSTTSAESAPHIRVKARGNLMWEVTESPNLPDLDGTYLDGEALCCVTAKIGANAKFVRLIAFAKQRDVQLRLTKNNSLFSFPSKNHERMLKVLISKALSSPGAPFNGIIEFSCSETEVED
jgi:hypothetical protein